MLASRLPCFCLAQQLLAVAALAADQPQRAQPERVSNSRSAQGPAASGLMFGGEGAGAGSLRIQASSLRGAALASTATVRVGSSMALAHPGHIVGHNADDQYIKGMGSFADAGFVAAMAGLRAGNIRWPGGTSSDFFDWRTGGFVPLAELARRNLTNPAGKFDPSRRILLQHFHAALAASPGAAPLFVLNMLSSNLTEQMAMLGHAESLGLPLRYVELGNELYIPFQNYVNVFASVEQYATTARVWAEALTHRWPRLRVSVPAAGSSAHCKGKPSGSSGCEKRRTTWNAGLASALRGVSAVAAISVHQYPGATLPSLTTGTKCPSWGYGDTAQQTHELTQLHDTTEGGGVARMLGVPAHSALPELAEVAKELPGSEIFVSEYNMRDNCGAAEYTWAQGLFAATLALLYIQTPRVELTAVWSLGGAAGYTSLYTSNDSLAGLCCNLPRPTVVNAPTAQGLLLGALSVAAGNRSLVELLDITPNVHTPLERFASRPSTIPPAVCFYDDMSHWLAGWLRWLCWLEQVVLSRGFPNQTYNGLLGCRFRNPAGRAGHHTVFILNLSPREVALDLSRATSGAAPSACSVQQWSAAPGFHFRGVAGELEATRGALPATQAATARPYSAMSVTCVPG